VFGAVVTGEVQPLDETVDGLAVLDVEGMDGFRAADVLVELRRVRAKLAAVEARLVARVDGGAAVGRGGLPGHWGVAGRVRPHVAGRVPG
jgi:hypothetical protein